MASFDSLFRSTGNNLGTASGLTYASLQETLRRFQETEDHYADSLRYTDHYADSLRYAMTTNPQQQWGNSVSFDEWDDVEEETPEPPTSFLRFIENKYGEEPC